MKAIKSLVNITSLRSKSDGSLGLSVVTPELTAEQKLDFFNLQGINLIGYFKPLDLPSEDTTVTTDFVGKTPSQKLRAAIFTLYTRQNISEPFTAFYEKIMQRLITQIMNEANETCET